MGEGRDAPAIIPSYSRVPWGSRMALVYLLRLTLIMYLFNNNHAL